MKQTIVFEAENGVDLQDVLTRYSCTVEGLNEKSRVAWELALKCFETNDTVKVISVTTV